MAGPSGGSPHPITSTGDITFVSASKTGSPLLAYSTASEYGTIAPDGTGRQAIPNAKTSGAANAFDAEINPTGQRLAYITKGSYFSSGFLVTSYNGSTIDLHGGSPGQFGNDSVLNVNWADSTGADKVIWSGEELSIDGDPVPPECDKYTFGLAIETPKPPGVKQSGAPNRDAYICRAGIGLTQPTVSPDNRAFAVTASPKLDAINYGPGRVYVIPKASPGTGTYITPDGMAASHPDWAPDGSMIAFEGAGKTIWTVASSGGAPTKILDNASLPAWTPYGGTASAPGPGPKPTPKPKAKLLAVRHGHYTGTNSQGSVFELRTASSGRAVTQIFYAIAMPCDKKNGGIVGQFLSSGQPARIAASGTFRAVDRSSLGSVTITGRFSRGRATGTMRAVVATGHGQCRVSARWSARAGK